jgi:RNA 2',3'-cyclic 3'-phosphodiesterase
MPRLFAAIPVPAAVAARLAALRVDIRGARWVPAGQMHLTLRFIGEVPERAVSPLAAALGRVPVSPLAVRLDGVGAFPSPRHAMVLYARVAPDPALLAMQSGVEEAVRSVGVEGDERAFRPHVTLARLRQPGGHAASSFVGSTPLAADWEARGFRLYESRLHRAGAEHLTVAVFGGE